MQQNFRKCNVKIFLNSKDVWRLAFGKVKKSAEFTKRPTAMFSSYFIWWNFGLSTLFCILFCFYVLILSSHCELLINPDVLSLFSAANGLCFVVITFSFSIQNFLDKRRSSAVSHMRRRGFQFVTKSQKGPWVWLVGDPMKSVYITSGCLRSQTDREFKSVIPENQAPFIWDVSFQIHGTREEKALLEFRN